MKVVVIGGGIAGASTAYHLAREGADVVLAEHNHKGQATAAGAGIISPWLSKRVRIKPYYVLAREGAVYYPQLLELLKADGIEDVSYKKVGAMYVSAGSKRLDELEKLAKIQRLDAPEIGAITRLNPEESREKFPVLNEDFSALHLEGGARVDGRRLREALLQAAEKRGVRIIDDKVSLITDKGRVTGIKTSEEAIYADAVVAAAGAWTKELLAPAGIDVPIEPQKGQIMHLNVGEAGTSDWPVVMPKSSHYLLAFDDGKVVAGATREVGSGFDTRLTPDGMREVLREALKVAPGLEDAEVTEFRVGLRPAGPNIYPILGPVKEIEGLYLTAGFGPAGLNLAPLSGKLVAQQVLGQEPSIDMTPYLLENTAPGY